MDMLLGNSIDDDNDDDDDDDDGRVEGGRVDM
jgi:hypothetical protein